MLFNRLWSTFQMPETGRRGRKVTKNPPNARPSQPPFSRLSKMRATKLRWPQTDGLHGMCGRADGTSGGRISSIIADGAGGRVPTQRRPPIRSFSSKLGLSPNVVAGQESLEMPASFPPLSASLRHESVFRPARVLLRTCGQLVKSVDQAFKVLNSAEAFGARPPSERTRSPSRGHSPKSERRTALRHSCGCGWEN